MSKKITFVHEDLEIPCTYDKETSVLEVLLKNDIPIDHSCGGMGTCGTCLVWVISDPKLLPKRNEIEQERADDLKLNERERLSCQLPPTSTSFFFGTRRVK